MSSKVERLSERVDAITGKDRELPGWMRGMTCLQGKFVVHHLLRMACLEVEMRATAEIINALETEEHGTGPTMPKDIASYPVREAVKVRKWFMQNGKVEDALRRLCGLEGEITIESLEHRIQEVNDAIDKQNAEINAEITARTSKPPENQLAKTTGTSGGIGGG